jgi:aminopeptidase N
MYHFSACGTTEHWPSSRAVKRPEAYTRPGWPLIAAATLVFACPAHADTYPRQLSVDVVNYVFNLELRDDTNRIDGTTEVELLFREDGVRSFSLDLTGASPDGRKGMTVTAVRNSGRALSFRQAADRVQIDLGEPARKGERRSVTVLYGGIPADGLIIDHNRDGERVFFGDNFPDRCRQWLPTIDHPYDKAACEFVVTAPEQYQVIAPGDLVETTSLAGGRRLTRYREPAPIPTYCMVIGAARFAVETVAKPGNVPIQSWVYAAERDNGFADYRIARKPLEFFSWRIGPFPYEKLANVQSKTRYGGMENASAIFYIEESVTGQQRTEGLFAHEIAHQWFGDSVTESDWDHIWLSEGFATYLTHVYNEYTYGRDAMVRGLRHDAGLIAEFFKKSPREAVVNPANTKLDNILTPNTYQKASWFLHMLRRQVGEEAFWKGLTQFHVRFQNGNALTEDFRAVMEDISGRDLSDFFRQWLYTPGLPAIEGIWSYSAGVLSLEIRQTQAADTVYRTALDIGIVDAQNAAIRVETVQLDKKAQDFIFRCDRQPADIVLDPNTWLLMNAGRAVKTAR